MIFDFIPADHSFFIMKEQFNQFSNRVYITECARFEGYRRMKRRKLSSTVSLALLSLSIIVFNVLQLCDNYYCYNQSITAVTIMLSVLVLVLSLLVSYLNYSERELKYYECGLKLSSLCDEIDNIMNNPDQKDLSSETLGKLKDKYQRIIGECGINHIEIDHKRAELRILKKKSQSNKVNHDLEKNKDDNTKGDKERLEKLGIYLISPETWRDARICISHKMKIFRVWIEWNLFDVNFLYWILAFGIPVLAWYIIFESDVFGKCYDFSFLPCV